MAKKVKDEGIVEEPVEKPVKEKVPTKAQIVAAEAAAVDWSDEVYFGEGPWPVISRAAALLKGFSRYYTGEPCKEGHDSPRKTKTSSCLACSRMKLRDRHKRRMKEDPEYKAKHSEKAKARRLAKKESAAPDQAA